MMRYFILLLATLSLLSACAATEEAADDSGERAEEISPVPGWYDDRISSRSDSLFIEGFAMASALDSSEAAMLSSETAMRNLKLGIDRAVDEARKELASGSGQYGSPQFIISLRGAVNSLDLSGLDADTGHEQSEGGAYFIYTRYRIQKSQLPELLSSAGLRDRTFLEQIADL